MKKADDESGERRRHFLVAAGLLLAPIVALLWMNYHKQAGVHDARAKLTKEADAGPLMRVAKVETAPVTRELALTGEAIPYTTATLYAKVAGYLSRIYVDKGDLVKKGQLLATIDSPETDKAYEAAVANSFNLGRIAGRYKVLLRKKLVSQQEADQAFANAKVADAQARQARVIKDYERIIAPFDAKVTARFVDPGALIQDAVAAQTGANPVVILSQTDLLRIYVFADQRDANSLQPGLPVGIRLSEQPDLQLTSTITRTAGQLDPATRMLLAEVDFDNSSLVIVPGAYVTVTVTVPVPAALQVPTAAVTARGAESLVGVVGEDGRLDFRKVRIIEDNGKVMRVVGPLQPGETVALDVGNRAEQGAKVRIAREGAPTEGRTPAERHD
jgi:RND family efflux transporter MFP subunit